MHKSRKDLVGQVFSRWTVVAEWVKENSRAHHWQCRCQCGSTKVVNGYSLLNGQSKSCGCLSREVTVTYLTKHGKSKSRAFTTWASMIDRCTNQNNKSYSDYGGRGIAVCKSWKTFSNFYADMGDPPEGMTLERVENELGYSKENCRWATRFDQSRNQRSNIMITYQGETKCFTDWCRHFQVPYGRAQGRYRSGRSFEDIFINQQIQRKNAKCSNHNSQATQQG